jgi:hypothetical protein
LTFSKTAALGSWTDAEINRAITQGFDKDGSKLKPPRAFGLLGGWGRRACARCRPL